jgi:hypothetical protein
MNSEVLRFTLGQSVPLEETRHVEFKEITGTNPVRSIVDISDEYAVAFLNSEGGRIFWGIRDSDRVVTGVTLSTSDRDRLRKNLTSKLNGIQPQLDPTRFRIILHPVIGGDDCLSVVELSVPSGASHDPYFTSGKEAFARIDGVTQKLSGQQLIDWARKRSPAKGVHERGEASINPDLIALAQRIRHIFSGHGLKPAHWPAFFEMAKAPFSINFIDLQSDASLLDWITEKKIQWISQTFLVRLEWIRGEDSRVFESQSYDKNPNQFLSVISRHVDALIYQDVPASPEAWFVRWGLGVDWIGQGQSGVFMVVRVPLARLSNELTIYKYVSDFEPYGWNEGRTAVQLRAWARILFVTKGICCIGREVSYELGKQIWNNDVFLNEIFEDYSRIERCRDDWCPEDYALYSSESVVAKDDPFFPAVIEFLKKHGLPYQETQLFGRQGARP